MKKNTFKGKITSGKFKNQDFEITSKDGMYYNTYIKVGDKVLSGVTKVTIIFKVEEPARVIIDSYNIN